MFKYETKTIETLISEIGKRIEKYPELNEKLVDFELDFNETVRNEFIKEIEPIFRALEDFNSKFGYDLKIASKSNLTEHFRRYFGEKRGIGILEVYNLLKEEFSLPASEDDPRDTSIIYIRTEEELKEYFKEK